MRRFILRHQLSAQAKSKTEAKSLQQLARSIELVELPTLDTAAKARIADDIGFAFHPHRKAFLRTWEGAIAVVVVMVLVFAQSARPGSALFVVRRGTDKVRSVVHRDVPFIHKSDDTTEHQEDSNDSHGSGSDDTGNDTQHKSGSDDSTDSKGGSDSGSGKTEDSTSHSGSDDSSPESSSTNDLLNTNSGSGDSGSSHGGGSDDTTPHTDSGGSSKHGDN